MSEAVLLRDGRVIGRFKPLPTHPTTDGVHRLTYIHLEDDEDAGVIHDPTEPFWAYRHAPGSAEMEVRPVKLELYEGIGNVYVVDLPGERTLLVPAHV